MMDAESLSLPPSLPPTPPSSHLPLTPIDHSAVLVNCMKVTATCETKLCAKSEWDISVLEGKVKVVPVLN
jgi:hypothetical protein